jgi:hypothetical protein
MSAKHTLRTDLEKHLSNEDNANCISREVIYDEFDSLEDQRLLRKVDLRWHFKSTITWYQLTLTCPGCYLY